MTPGRPSSRSSTFKPYTRSVSSPSPATGGRKDLGPLEYPHTHYIDDGGQTGFPTPAQYQVIERGYIDSLTPRRQAKALISQALFDRIWDVLHSADNVKENAQFRFWARKMFTLSKSHSVSFGGGSPKTMEQEVLLHDGLLVAVREQIYDLLCFCHGSTNHGGRDKTCALIRKHYTWVPKDLVAQFIKACPTCILKKCGHSEPGILSPPLGTSAGSLTFPTPVDENANQESTLPPLPSFGDYFNGMDGVADLPQDMFPSSLPSTPLTHSQFMFSPDNVNSSTPIEQLRHYNQMSSVATPLSGHPMTREVSLYRGLPDGWQYQNVDYRNAHADCLEHQRVAPILPYDPSLGRTRPRMPEIAPLFKADFEDFINYRAQEMEDNSFHLASTTCTSPQAEDIHSQPVSPAIGEGSPDLSIDPLLLALSASIHGPSFDYASLISRGLALPDFLKAEGEVNMASPSPAPLSPAAVSDFRTADTGTSPTEQASLDSVNYFHGFSINRDNSESQLDSAIDQDDCRFWREADNVNESGDSTPNSVRSDVSRLSFVAAVDSASPGSEASTPMTTAPVTPVDEIPNEQGGIGGPLGESDVKETYIDNQGVELDEGVSICDAEI